MKLGTLLTEGSQWPIGHFQVTKTFEISPGGGWSVTFDQGDIIRVEDATRDGYPGIQKIQKYNALKGVYEPKRPPISGMDVFPIDRFSDSRNWVAKFTQNTKTISKGQADSMVAAMPKEVILTASDAIRMLNGLSQTTQVKITVI